MSKPKVILTSQQEDDLRDDYEFNGYSPEALMQKYNVSRSTVNRRLVNIIPQSIANDLTRFDDCDEEIVDVASKAQKALTRQRDINRVHNKIVRETARVDNAREEIGREIGKLLKANTMKQFTRVHKVEDGTSVGVVHFSDVHFNECIDTPTNKYDFYIASQRVRKHVMRAISTFKSYGVSKVVVTFTGDMFNSDRRLDEVLTNATNRSQAIFIGTEIMKQAILELNGHFNVDVFSVTGNEGRVDKDVHWGTMLANNNYDLVMHMMLYGIFLDCPGVEVHLQHDYSEFVVNILNKNFLLIHGHNGVAGKNIEANVSKCRSRYLEMDVKIDYVLMGHIHSAHVGDFFARCSGLPGGNDYSEKALNLVSKASQNLYVVTSNGDIDGIKVDLQSVEGIEGYPFNEKLIAYNNKMSNDRQKATVIVTVV